MTMTLRVLVRGPCYLSEYNNCFFMTARELFPILLVVVQFYMRLYSLLSKASGTFRKVQEALDKVNTKLQENLSGYV
ncbi:hypothetical protein ACT7DH_06875 [Bacillus pacificus]